MGIHQQHGAARQTDRPAVANAWAYLHGGGAIGFVPRVRDITNGYVNHNPTETFNVYSAQIVGIIQLGGQKTPI